MSDYKASEMHSKLAGPIVASIVKPVLQSGGTPEEICVLTESVLVGVALMIVSLGGDEIVIDTMTKRAKERLAEIRLKDIQTEGRS